MLASGLLPTYMSAGPCLWQSGPMMKDLGISLGAFCGLSTNTGSQAQG